MKIMMPSRHVVRLFEVLGDPARLGLVEHLLRAGPTAKSEALRALGGGAKPRYDRLKPLLDADVLELDDEQVRVRDAAATRALIQQADSWVKRWVSSIARVTDARLSAADAAAQQDPDRIPPWSARPWTPNYYEYAVSHVVAPRVAWAADRVFRDVAARYVIELDELRINGEFFPLRSMIRELQTAYARTSSEEGRVEQVVRQVIQRQLCETVILQRTYARANGTEAQLSEALSDAALTAAATPLTLVVAEATKQIEITFGRPDRPPLRS